MEVRKRCEALETNGERQPMSTNRPDPGEFLERAQQMLRELFGDPRGDDEPWGAATRSETGRGHREPSPEQQKENLTFALGTRAVEALEDLALNVAAIRQRLERADTPPSAPPPPKRDRQGPKGPDAAGQP
jgi:hypothetical protein